MDITITIHNYPYKESFLTQIGSTRRRFFFFSIHFQLIQSPKFNFLCFNQKGNIVLPVTVLVTKLCLSIKWTFGVAVLQYINKASQNGIPTSLFLV